MASVKLTKNEQKKQKDGLKRFQRYLPTLILKKQQLQTVIRQIEVKAKDLKKEQTRLKHSIENWIHVFGENVNLEQYVMIESIRKGTSNIAGVQIPIYDGIDFKEIEYDLFNTPAWIDPAIEFLKKILSFDVEISVLEEQIKYLDHELRITTQRVNLFEKVKIPEAKENIRMIKIYLGDQQTAAVVRGKMAKNKLVKVS